MSRARLYVRTDGATFRAQRSASGFWRVEFAYDSRAGLGRMEGQFCRKTLAASVEEMTAVGLGMNHLAVEEARATAEGRATDA